MLHQRQTGEESGICHMKKVPPCYIIIHVWTSFSHSNIFNKQRERNIFHKADRVTTHPCSIWKEPFKIPLQKNNRKKKKRLLPFITHRNIHYSIYKYIYISISISISIYVFIYLPYNYINIYIYVYVYICIYLYL